MTNNARGSLGGLVARLLEGSWRAVPPTSNITSDELKRILPLLLKSGAASLAWRVIRNGPLSKSESAIELRSAYQLHSLQAAVHRSEIEEVVSLLNSEGIEPFLVKGWSVARVYPEEGLRPYGDMDLCFGPLDYQRAIKMLGTPEARGYSVDVHEGFRKLDDKPAEELIAHSKTVRFGTATFRVLTEEDQLRILCTHLLRHSAWRPLWLCDIACAIENRSDDFEWDRCFGKNPRQADWACCAIGLAHRLLGARVDDTPAGSRARSLPAWLIRDVVSNWDAPFPERYPPLSYLPPMSTYLRHPAGLWKALRKRWPDPIEATIRLRGPFNGMPRFPFQVGNALLRVLRFVTRTQ